MVILTAETLQFFPTIQSTEAYAKMNEIIKTMIRVKNIGRVQRKKSTYAQYTRAR